MAYNIFLFFIDYVFAPLFMGAIDLASHFAQFGFVGVGMAFCIVLGAITSITLLNK